MFIPGDICWSIESIDSQFYAWPCRIVSLTESPLQPDYLQIDPRIVPKHTLVCHSMALYCKIKTAHLTNVYKVCFLPFQNDAMRKLDYLFEEKHLYTRLDCHLVPLSFICISRFDSQLLKNCALIQALAMASSWAVSESDQMFRLGAEVITTGCIVCLVNQPHKYFMIDKFTITKSSLLIHGHYYIPNPSFTHWKLGIGAVLDKKYIMRRFYHSYRVLEPPVQILERYSWEGFPIPKKRAVRFS